MEELYIDKPEELAQLCTRLRGTRWLTLDTEFVREKTYYAKLCLIQVGTEGLVACIDMLALDDAGPLLDLLYDTSITKVVHASSQDLEIFTQLRGRPPGPVFDTQIAASLLGFGDQVSYAALVEKMLDVNLDKSHARTDWSRRPLSAEQRQYAWDDVRYLHQVYRRELSELESRGRLGWLDEDFVQLEEPARYVTPPESAWLRVKGSRKLRGRQLATVQALAGWRERTAQDVDRPRRWVLSDDALLAIARKMPRDIDALGAIAGVARGLVERHADALLACVEHALGLPEEALPRVPRPLRLDRAQEALVDAMMALVRLRSAEFDVSTASLTTRKDLERVAAGHGDVAVLHGWRAELVGHELKKFLDGEIELEVDGGRLATHQTGTDSPAGP